MGIDRRDSRDSGCSKSKVFQGELGYIIKIDEIDDFLMPVGWTRHGETTVTVLTEMLSLEAQTD